MLQERPYFMKNEEWYTDKHNKYVLTDKRQKKLVKATKSFTMNTTMTHSIWAY